MDTKKAKKVKELIDRKSKLEKYLHTLKRCDIHIGVCRHDFYDSSLHSFVCEDETNELEYFLREFEDKVIEEVENRIKSVIEQIEKL